MTRAACLFLLLALDAAAGGPPVKGHYQEANSGKFDLVDGVANTANGDTILYFTEKPIASTVLTSSICGMTQASAMALLRNSGYVLAGLDKKGKPIYFEAGTPLGGKRTMQDGRPVRASGGKVKRSRVSGSLTEKTHLTLDFDLPLAKPEHVRRSSSEELIAVYEKVRGAAKAKDLAGMLAAQGFDAKQIAAIRALPGIDADVAALANLFLDPGTPEDPFIESDLARIGARGANPKGAKFINYYTFEPCGNNLVLTKVGQNPQ